MWNQPLRGYRITSKTEVSAQEANKLIGVTPTGGTTTEKSGSVPKGTWAHQAPVAVTAGTNLSVQMTGTGDGDLYVRFGAKPTVRDWTILLAFLANPQGRGPAERFEALGRRLAPFRHPAGA